MGREGERWRATVDQYFGFLRGAGFTRVDVEDATWWATSVTYSADTVALRISSSREFNRVEVDLIRLVDHAVPEYPVWITDAPLNWMLLDNVIEARRPDLLPRVRAGKGLSTKAARAQLELAAALVREVTPDFLTGETAAIDDGSRIVRARVREHPQELTVHLPASASADELAAETARARASAPPGVGVEVRRYGWPRLRRRRGNNPSE